MTKVVAVADYAGRQAGFAARLSAAFSAAGLGLEFRTHRELAAEVSVEQPLGQPPAITPDRPLLWLSPGDAGWPPTPDGRFLAAETLAAARSIAQLTRSPVLNRPSAVSLCGTLPPGSPRAVRGARHLDPGAVRAERFTGTWPPDAADAGPLEVYDYAANRRSYGPPPSPAGPFRYRAAVGPARPVQVRVVGDRALTTTDVAPATRDASRRVAAFYQLDMAIVWWLVGPDDGARTLSRIDGWPWDADAGAGGDSADDVVDDVAEAVAAWMAARLRRPAQVSR